MTDKIEGAPASPPRRGAVCVDCGGSGLRVDELVRGGAQLTDDEREQLDSTRCHGCYGSGRR